MRKYNAVILGARGSGKTVYLSALYHELSTPGNTGYFLEAPLQQQTRLTNAYTSLVGKWLKPTALGQTDLFEFGVTVKAQTGSNHRALTICYYDMAGGRQTDFQEDLKLVNETASILQGADILLGLIDGERLQKRIKGDTGRYTGSDRYAIWLCASGTRGGNGRWQRHYRRQQWRRP